MKTMKKWTALLLCIAMVVGLVGCGTQNEETQPSVTAPSVTQPPVTVPPTTEPPVTEPPAENVYADARTMLDSTDAVSLDILVTTTTTVAGQVFFEQSAQVLTYTGLNTDALQVSLTEDLTFGTRDGEADDGDTSIAYSEVYADGTVYASLVDTYFFSGSLTSEDIAGRYLPVVLLDAALYESLSAESTGNGTTISFAAPTAAEGWAMPADAELLDASGSALVSTDGTLEQMNYTVTYQYGPSEVKLEVESKPRAEAERVSVPDSPDSYPVLQDVDTLRLYIRSSTMTVQADSVTTSSLESIVSQAAGVVRNQSRTMNLYKPDDELMTKIETNLYFKDFYFNEEQKMKLEETFRDGKYTSVIDDGVPTRQSGIDQSDFKLYCAEIMLAHFTDPSFWADASIADLGSTYLVEYTFSEDFGDTIQNSICNMFWEDPAYLNNLASAYVANETTGYLAVDKYTGLATAAGYYYQGQHTIDGYDYLLTAQSDQSIRAPGLSAYYSITEELLPEAEPENRATPLFYHVTGENGQEMWMLGTVHVGDERTAYLPQEIYDAFAASDALALEYDSDAFEEQMEADDKLSEAVSAAYYYSDGTTTADHLEEDLYNRALQYLKASGSYNMNAPYMKASAWSSSIESFYLRQGYGLSGDKGVEARLEKLAEEQNKPILEVESGLFQIQMNTGWSEELQQLLLEGTLETGAMEYYEGVVSLYEKWCQGDEAVMRQALSDEVDTSELTDEELAEYNAQLPLMEEYNKAMSTDRNAGMLNVAVSYLESGETVFFAVGLAHLLDGTNGLVDALRQAGYTVELVTYAQ